MPTFNRGKMGHTEPALQNQTNTQSVEDAWTAFEPTGPQSVVKDEDEGLSPAELSPGMLRAASHPGVIVWDEIIQAREEFRGLSLRDVSAKLGLPHAQFCAVMSGKNKMTEKFAGRLAEALGLQKRLLINLIRSYEDMVHGWHGGFYAMLVGDTLDTAACLDISDPSLSRILGIDVADVTKLRNGRVGLDAAPETLARALLLIGVQKRLKELFGNDRSIHRQWLRSQNTALASIPLERMYELHGLADVIDYLRSRTGS